MSEKYGVKWSREETILACELYCRTPFSKIGKNNKDIIALAELIGRTPSSVGLKMANLAHFDEELKARKLVGMGNASKLDGEIWGEFCNDWEGLSYQASKILSQLKKIDIEEIAGINDMELFPPGEYKEQMLKRRVGQYFFRMSVLNAYENKCCITGLTQPDLLIASHIKPWKDSDDKTEKTNPSNGLCLNNLHDKAFDKGLITIDSNYHIIFSKNVKETKMDEETRSWFDSYKGKQIILPTKFYPNKEFIQYHNDTVFQG